MPDKNVCCVSTSQQPATERGPEAYHSNWVMKNGLDTRPLVLPLYRTRAFVFLILLLPEPVLSEETHRG